MQRFTKKASAYFTHDWSGKTLKRAISCSNNMISKMAEKKKIKWIIACFSLDLKLHLTKNHKNIILGVSLPQKASSN